MVDLDTSRTSPDTVLRDLTGIQNLIERAGGRYITDRSPSGGHHLYVPLAEALTLGEARAIARAIAHRWPSVDAIPMLNPVTGVIRPPGSLYKGGRGYQELITPLAVAYDILQRPAKATVVEAIRRELQPELTALASQPSSDASLSDDLADAPWQPLPGGPRELTARFREIATTGVYDSARYRTPSQARQAVLCSAVAAGMRLIDVAKRLDSGLWPGLSSFYQRYHRAHRRKALLRDWRNAHRHVLEKRQTQPLGRNSVRYCDTRGSDTHAGAASATAYQQIRIWVGAVDAHARDHLTPDQHMLLRSLAEAAQKTGSIEVEFGVRSLSVAAGKRTHQAVAKNLVALRNQPDPFIELVEEHQGTVADRYRLRLPDRYDHHRWRTWRRSTIHGIRAPFRELGAIAALTYEALETASEPLTGRGIADLLGRSPSAVSSALASLAAWDLAEYADRRWRLSPRADLNLVAEALGVLDEIREQLQRIRGERQQWWHWLGVRRLPSRPGTHARGARVDQALDADEPPPDLDDWLGDEWQRIPSAPPEDEQLTLLRMLEQLLGAEPIRTAGRRRPA
ncbi:hypothetical protein AB0H36_27590 [Kribbella sp. NPDC050820]|uniref:hypothetical protein n=1 Tax=Kribbella sp. NPDC050820 TaxID=3155408 RepID=UPI0033CA5ECD